MEDGPQVLVWIQNRCFLSALFINFIDIDLNMFKWTKAIFIKNLINIINISLFSTFDIVYDLVKCYGYIAYKLNLIELVKMKLYLIWIDFLIFARCWLLLIIFFLPLKFVMFYQDVHIKTHSNDWVVFFFKFLAFNWLFIWDIWFIIYIFVNRDFSRVFEGSWRF